MLRFSKSATLESHLRRVAPLGGQERLPGGNVLHYVLIEQVQQHVTKFSLKDISCRGYVSSYLTHDPFNHLEGGEPGQRYLVEYEHLCRRLDLLKGAVVLRRSPKAGLCLEVWKESKQKQQSKLKEYPGSIADFEQAVGFALPPLTAQVSGLLWRAACQCIKNFSKPDVNPDVLSQSNQPLLLWAQEGSLTLVGFYKGYLQLPVSCRLPLTGSLGEQAEVVVPLNAKFIQRLALAGGEVIALGYDQKQGLGQVQGVFGLKAEDYECSSLCQSTSRQLVRFCENYIKKLVLVARRYVVVAEAQEMVAAAKPEAIDGQSVCLIETDEGELKLYPERNIEGSDYALISVCPHSENQGEWPGVVVIHEYLHAGWNVLARLLGQLRLLVDQQPLGCFSLYQCYDQLVLGLELVIPKQEVKGDVCQQSEGLAAQILIQVSTCRERIDDLDIAE